MLNIDAKWVRDSILLVCKWGTGSDEKVLSLLAVASF